MKKVLMVVTSHDKLGDTGRKTGIWLSEFAEPYFAFKDRGIEIAVASPKGGAAPIDPESLKDADKNPIVKRYLDEKIDVLSHTIELEMVDFHQYDCIFYPGGHGPMWDLATDVRNGKLVSDFFNHGKIVAAVCHGPASLIGGISDESGESFLKDRNVTGFSDAEERAVGLEKVVPFLLEDKLKSLGGVYSKAEKNFEAHIVVDGSIFTGQNPASALPLAKRVIEELYSK